MIKKTKIKKKPVILAIETSCDETSIAIIKNNIILSNIIATQISEHQKYQGVMPEVASRLHVEKIVDVLAEALQQAKIKIDELNAVAFTRGPGLSGSLLIGLQAAKTISLVCCIPLIPVNHLAAHIYACEFVDNFCFPLLALVVSGGNTELILMKKHLHFEIIGETVDDAIGECFDKVARILNLNYPGGVIIDQLAKTGHHTYQLPMPLKNSKNYNFSYSGLKTAVIDLVNKEKKNKHVINIENLCCSFEETAIDLLIIKTIRAAKEYNVKQILLSGGVSANSYLRKKIIEKAKEIDVKVILAPLSYTTDNAAMVAKIAEHLYQRKQFASLKVDIDTNWSITKSLIKL